MEQDKTQKWQNTILLSSALLLTVILSIQLFVIGKYAFPLIEVFNLHLNTFAYFLKDTQNFHQLFPVVLIIFLLLKEKVMVCIDEKLLLNLAATIMAAAINILVVYSLTGAFVLHLEIMNK